MTTIQSIEFVYCACGCGFTLSKYKIEKNGKIRKDVVRHYINRHSRRGMKHSEETRKIMSKIRMGKYAGENHYNFGKTRSEEVKKKISENRKGKYIGANHHYFGKKRPEISGENNPLWKGNNIKTIEAIHYRIRAQLLMPMMCEICGVCSPQELSNKDHKYSFDLADWQWLCIRCHRDYDNNYEKNFKANNDARRLKKEGKLKL